MIDLCFHSNFQESTLEKWALFPKTGSDHEAIGFSMRTREAQAFLNPLAKPTFNIEKADWEKLEKGLKGRLASLLPQLEVLEEAPKPEGIALLSASSPATRFPILGDLDSLVLELTRAIQDSASEAIPKSRVVERSKPWWSSELLEKRKEMAKKDRERRVQDPEVAEENETRYRKARSSYFSSITEAKTNHWNSFLEKAQDKEIFTALRYQKQKSLGKVPPLRLRGELVNDFSNQ